MPCVQALFNISRGSREQVLIDIVILETDFGILELALL
jgi:hypothetical protein